MSDWPLIPLGEVAAVGSGSAFPVAFQGKPDGDIPFLKVSDMNLGGNEERIVTWNNSITHEVRKRLRATAFPAGSVIFPKIGAAIATNKKRMLVQSCCIDNNVMAIVPQTDRLLSEFLLALLQTKDLSDFASRSNPPSMRKGSVEDWHIPLPPLDEQRRIVDLLNRAAGIRRLREQALAKARETIPALFLAMFGDLGPGVNYPIHKLDAVTEIGSGITKGRKLNGQSTIEVPYLRVANVQDGHLDLNEIKTIPATARDLERYALRPGDLLMTEGGDPDKLGRGAIWSGQIPECLHQNHVFRVRADPAVVLPDYLASVVSSSYGKAYFLQVAKRTTGIASINRTQLGAFPVPVAPLSLQHGFVGRLADLRSIIIQQKRALAASHDLERALMARLLG